MEIINKQKNGNNTIFISVVKTIALSLLVVLISLFFISKKANLDIDEMYTYGLSNNQFQVNVENNREYTGEELLLNYVAANDNHLFDIQNVFFNQKMDTHPPLYFTLVNFVCSINKHKFSMMYGLLINIIFLIILYWETRHLLYLITKNETFSSIIPVLVLASYAYINNYSFTRMYVMLSAISMALVVIIISLIDANKKIDLKFLIKFYLICLLGMLTHYHFVIIAFFFSVVLGIFLIKKKLVRELLLVFASGVLSIVTALVIFPGAINHIFSNTTSTHSLPVASGSINIFDNLSTLSRGLVESFFGYGIILYIVLLIITLIMFITKKKKAIEDSLCNCKLYFILLFSAIFYFIVICFTVRLSFHRYLYNIYPILTILMVVPLYNAFCSINKSFMILIVIIMCIFNATSMYNNSPTSLNAEDALFEDYLSSSKDTKTIFLYRSIDSNGIKNSINTSLWKLPAPLYLFKDMEKVTFVDISDEDAFRIYSDDINEKLSDLFLVIYTSENDEYLLNSVLDKYSLSDYQRIYFTTYFHVYRLK